MQTFEQFLTEKRRKKKKKIHRRRYYNKRNMFGFPYAYGYYGAGHYHDYSTMDGGASDAGGGGE